jgi:hypothetical protein
MDAMLVMAYMSLRHVNGALEGAAAARRPQAAIAPASEPRTSV